MTTCSRCHQHAALTVSKRRFPVPRNSIRMPRTPALSAGAYTSEILMVNKFREKLKEREVLSFSDCDVVSRVKFYCKTLDVSFPTRGNFFKRLKQQQNKTSGT